MWRCFGVGRKRKVVLFEIIFSPAKYIYFWTKGKLCFAFSNFGAFGRLWKIAGYWKIVYWAQPASTV
jgi:hypothetical protein